MHQNSRLPALRFRFTDPADAKVYGPADGEWWVYDEAAITAMSFDQLQRVEAQLPAGVTLIEVMQGLREETVLGYHAGSWLAIHLADPDTSGAYPEYAPKDLLIQWERVPEAEEPAEAADPLDSSGSPSSPSEE